MSNLRTSWATYMVNTGAPISLISRYMGHADVETTVRWYTKPNETQLLELTKMWSHPSSFKYDSRRPELMSMPAKQERFISQPSKSKNKAHPRINQDDLPETVDIKYVLEKILGIQL